MLGTIAGAGAGAASRWWRSRLRGARRSSKPVKVDARRRVLPPVHERIDVAPEGRGCCTHAEPGGQRAGDHGSGPRRARRRSIAGVSWLPLYHDMGLIGFVIAPLYHVNTITFLPPLLFLKRPVRWLETISRHRGSISFGPNFAYALCVKRIKEQEMEGLDLSSWRVAGLRRRADPRREPRGVRRQVRAGRLQREGVRVLLRDGRVDARHLVQRSSARA